MKKKTIEWFISIFFSIFGLIFMIVGGIMLLSNLNFKETAVKTTAIITDISRNNNKSGTGVYIEYSVNNKKYTQILNYYNSGMIVGQKIDIYYNPDNPNKIQSEGNVVVIIIFISLGTVFLIIGGIIILVKISKIKSKNKLIKTGKLVYADIEDVVCNINYRVNRMHPYIINCRWKDSSGTVYLLKSENIWYNPETTIEEKQLKQLPVYINENNPKKYYIDISKLVENVKDLR